MNRITDDLELLTRKLEQRGPQFDDEGLHVEDIKKAVMKQLNFYKEENAKVEAALKKLHLLPTDLSAHVQTQLDNLTSLQQSYGTKVCNLESVVLSQSDLLKKQNNYITKVKSCIKIYNTLIEKLSKEINDVRGELESSKQKLDSLFTVSDEVKALQIKMERYEKELLKFEKKYKWLSDPQFHLISIHKHTEKLNNLRITKEKLLQELQVYEGLKPDLDKAAKQLIDIEKEYASI